jgi:hypothetical protein
VEKEFRQQFWVESGEGSEKTYKAQIVNGIARLGFVELTEVTVDVTMHDGNLRRITVTEWTAWYPLVSVGFKNGSTLVWVVCRIVSS